MITIGVDAHKRVHVAVAVDDAGRELGRWQGPNSPDGWRKAYEWAMGLGAPRRWGIEGAWNYGRGLAQHLVASGETVHEVNPRWTAHGRRRGRKPGKSDRLDAAIVTNLDWESTEDVWHFYNQRCAAEKYIRAAKEDLAITALPTGEFYPITHTCCRR